MESEESGTHQQLLNISQLDLRKNCFKNNWHYVAIYTLGAGSN